jgi:hypothetical protein
MVLTVNEVLTADAPVSGKEKKRKEKSCVIY